MGDTGGRDECSVGGLRLLLRDLGFLPEWWVLDAVLTRIFCLPVFLKVEKHAVLAGGDRCACDPRFCVVAA